MFYTCIVLVAVNLGADELASLLHDVAAEWRLLAIALEVDMKAGRTSRSVSCEQFMIEMFQQWIQTKGKDATIDVIVEALESCVMGNQSLAHKIRDDPEIKSTYYHGI